jgi:hypothetical protein
MLSPVRWIILRQRNISNVWDIDQKCLFIFHNLLLVRTLSDKHINFGLSWMPETTDHFFNTMITIFLHMRYSMVPNG